MSQKGNIHHRRVYKAVMGNERRGDYLGKTVQLIPHITDEIKARVAALGRRGLDVAITEVGGTVGDMEGLPFLEAIRQLSHEYGPGNVLVIHLTLLPFLRAARS